MAELAERRRLLDADKRKHEKVQEYLATANAYLDEGRFELAEEVADLFILIVGTAIAADFDLKQAFWDKMDKLMQRQSKMIDGRIRVSEFREKE